MNIPFAHLSVMPTEVMSCFGNLQGKTVVDATAGGGGHLRLLASAVGPTGRVLAFDRDLRAHQDDAALGVQKQFPDVVTMFHRPFSGIRQELARLGIDGVDGLLCDLGVSSNQLDDRSRGFSFLSDGPIDMRMDDTQGQSAYDWLASTREDAIASALYNLGGERKSRSIARAIKNSWPLENSTLVLAKLVLSALRQRSWSKIHPATRTFQAIRMAVNHEVDELSSLLADLPHLLAKQGVAVFLSFHSVEDRLIKNTFKDLSAKKDEGERDFMVLTKKPLVASAEEISHNRRSRSAKLRAIQRLS